jgi:hypothetical protein
VIPQKVISNGYVLSAAVLNGIIRHADCTLISTTTYVSIVGVHTHGSASAAATPCSRTRFRQSRSAAALPPLVRLDLDPVPRHRCLLSHATETRSRRFPVKLPSLSSPSFPPPPCSVRMAACPHAALPPPLADRQASAANPAGCSRTRRTRGAGLAASQGAGGGGSDEAVAGHRVGELRGGAADAQPRDSRARRRQVHLAWHLTANRIFLGLLSLRPSGRHGARRPDL